MSYTLRRRASDVLQKWRTSVVWGVFAEVILITVHMQLLVRKRVYAVAVMALSFPLVYLSYKKQAI